MLLAHICLSLGHLFMLKSGLQIGHGLTLQTLSKEIHLILSQSTASKVNNSITTDNNFGLGKKQKTLLTLSAFIREA